MRWLPFGLSLFFLALGLVLWLLLKLFLTPFVCAVVAFGLGSAAWMIRGDSGLTRMRKGTVFFAMPLLVLVVMGDLALWRSAEAMYSLDVICDELRVTTTKADPVVLRPAGFRTAEADGPGLHLKIGVFAIQHDGTTDSDLAAVTGNQDLDIRPLKSPAADEPPFTAVTVDSDNAPDIKVEFTAPNGEATGGEFWLKWDREWEARKPLIVAAHAPYKVSLWGTAPAHPPDQASLQSVDYSLEVRNCTVEFGTYIRDLKHNATLQIHGQAQPGVPVVISFESNDKKSPEVDLNLGSKKDPMPVAIWISGNIRDPIFGLIKAGQLNVEGESPMSIKAETAVKPQISVKGDATFESESCQLQEDGLHVRANGKAAELTADLHDQLPSELTTLLQSPVFLAFVAVIVWLFDKLFNLYDVMKDSQPPNAAGT